MLRRTIRFRSFALAFVALHLVLRAVTGVADARARAAGGPWEDFVHFESKGSTHLPPEHGTDCGLCSYVSTALACASAPGLELPPVRRASPVALRTLRPLCGVTVALHPARAPPVA